MQTNDNRSNNLKHKTLGGVARRILSGLGTACRHNVDFAPKRIMKSTGEVCLHVSMLLLSFGLFSGSQAFAQTKAANLARMRAERLNGGLRLYRADQCMHALRGEACLISVTDEGFLFRFRGGEPGWQQQIPPQPSLMTEVLVSADGDRILDVSYNGPLLRQNDNSPPVTPPDHP